MVHPPAVRPRVVVADDNLLVLDALRDLLDTGGFDVVGTALDGTQALELAAAVRPDVALVDARMPHGGPELVQRLLRQSPGLPVVVYTAHGDPELEVEMTRAGAVALVVKGESEGGLLKVLREAVGA